MAALCKATSIEEWEFVKSVAAISQHHKVRIASRKRDRNANLSHSNRRAATLEDENTKRRKPHNSGQGSKGMSLFSLCKGSEWHESDDDWYESDNDWYEDFGHQFHRQREVIDGGISQPVLHTNAWTAFGELSGGTLVPAQQGFTNRPCAICCERGMPLIANLECMDVACEPCWRWWVAQFPHGHGDAYPSRRMRSNAISCFMPGCPCNVGIPARVRAPIAAGKPKQSGNVCTLCCETNGPLLQNSGCSCTACAHCWRRWVNTKLSHCRATRQLDRVPCFTPGCCKTMCKTLLRRTCATSVGGSDLIYDLAVRRRLQSNTLYPAHAQVNCPRPGCLGLGYLDFDQVMCFVCEHQWVSNGCGPSETMPSEVKECPQCGVQIVKNGGCDHMNVVSAITNSGGQLWLLITSILMDNFGERTNGSSINGERKPE
eukprot:CAMPEP_0172927654 /NCGR_PEP_ID=MMETSP1075-20121228/217577_1 /TAXON_ID=2916 /ORGANISM="Ceratium fusus, Strain PA161109" /LENGTH=429 /DNA_ID=CAMNT_0013788919 /DNA_START=44 /DNA_END=1334 /DNA_ORIENTATION=-